MYYDVRCCPGSQRTGWKLSATGLLPNENWNCDVLENLKDGILSLEVHYIAYLNINDARLFRDVADKTYGMVNGFLTLAMKVHLEATWRREWKKKRLREMLLRLNETLGNQMIKMFNLLFNLCKLYPVSDPYL